MSAARISRRHLGRAVIAAGAAIAAWAGPNPSAATSDARWQPVEISETSPEPRWDHTLAADDRGKALILFGGRDLAGVPFDDTWRYDRSESRWSRLDDVTGPAARFGHAVATSASGDGFYLFGGQSGDQFFNDLWFFAFSGQWDQIHDGADSAPSPRYGTSFVATDQGTVLLSHGFTFEGRFDDTWQWDPKASGWADLTPPSETDRPLKRCLHEAVWDARSRQMLLYGGCSSGFGPCPQGDLWSFDPESATWRELALSDAPEPRSNPALVYDEPRGRALLFGGLTERGPDARLWVLRHGDSGPSWAELGVEGEGPSPRSSHDAALIGPRLYLFGGTGEGGPINDLWSLDIRELTAS